MSISTTLRIGAVALLVMAATQIEAPNAIASAVAPNRGLTATVIQHAPAPLMLKRGRWVQLSAQEINDLRGGSNPQLGPACELDMNNDDAISLLPDLAKDSFVYAPFWIQNCGGSRYLRAWPTDDEHFHLSFEDATIVSCELPECDPLSEPRGSMQMHVATRHFRFDQMNSGTTPSSRVYFAADRVTIGGGAASLCFRQRATGPWIAWTSDAEPGAWLCFARLDPGTYDLSEWMGVGATYIEMSAPLQGPVSYWTVTGLRLRTIL
jgi:hypothetical protein